MIIDLKIEDFFNQASNFRVHYTVKKTSEKESIFMLYIFKDNVTFRSNLKMEDTADNRARLLSKMPLRFEVLNIMDETEVVNKILEKLEGLNMGIGTVRDAVGKIVLTPAQSASQSTPENVGTQNP